MGAKIWYDDVVGRLNTDEKGMYLGTFAEEDKIITLYSDGSYTLNNTELTNRFDADKVVMIEKFKPQAILSAVYYDADKNNSMRNVLKLKPLL